MFSTAFFFLLILRQINQMQIRHQTITANMNDPVLLIPSPASEDIITSHKAPVPQKKGKIISMLRVI